MYRPRPERKGRFTPMSRAVRIAAHRSACEVCGKTYQTLEASLPGQDNPFRYYEEAIHHLLARRWCEENGITPHDSRNLVSCCDGCHAKATAAEDRLWHGDVIGFLMEMRALNFPVKRIVDFAVSVGLKTFGEVRI
jgi:hypothetical protein